MRCSVEKKEMFAPVDAWLEKQYPEMERQLLQLLSIPSVQAKAEPGAPFGAEVARAYRFVLDLSAQLGYTVTDVDGYIGFADFPGQTLNAAGEEVAAITHVDVVAAKEEDWQQHPFQPEIVDGKIYGRGAIDDKGPLIASMYALAAIDQCDLPCRRRLRHLFGNNEESGFACLEHYLQKYPQPWAGIVPDARFPAVIGEKGLMRWSFAQQWLDDSANANIILKEINGGSMINIVPAKADALFEVNEVGYALFQQAFSVLSLAEQQKISLDMENGALLRVTAYGQACHASLPELGENANVLLLRYLSFLAGEVKPTGAGRFLADAIALYDDEQLGSGLGIAGADELSWLTNVPALLRVTAKGGRIDCDTRYPVSMQQEYYVRHLSELAESLGWQFDPWYCCPVLHMDASSPVVSTVLQIYHEYMQDSAAENRPLVVGSGTYGRMLQNCLPFGPIFPGQENLCHQADEYISQKDLLHLAKIYARAMYALANL